MKIGIDLKPFFTGSKYRGIGTYTREIIKQIINLNEDIEYHFLNLYDEYDDDPKMNKKCKLHNYYNGPKVIDVGERQLFRNKYIDKYRESQVKHFLQKSQIDVMFFTSPNEYGNMYKKEWFSSVFTVGILYDLIPLLFPEQCLFDKRYTDDYKESLEFLKSLDLLLAISESAKEDAVKLLGIPEEKIKVIYAGIDRDFRKLDKVNISGLKSKYNITDSFILFAGGIDFKKNIEGLIHAYAKMGKNTTNRYQLVIVGNLAEDLKNKFFNIAKQEGVEGRVLCIGFVPKQDLIELYNTTEMLVFPSLYEGFGLPVIEAMACGARVVTSNCSSLKEIAEGHAVLVNPKSAKSITKGMLTIINNPIDSMNLAEQSIEYALGYTWEKVAYLTCDAIKKAYFMKNIDNHYNFTVEDSLLEDIANLFAEAGENFSYSHKIRLANEMLSIQENKELPVIEGGTRIIYDLTVVREWLKAKYSTGIGRVCIELYNQLCKIANVIPVSIDGAKDKFNINKVSIDSFEVLQDKIALEEGDIYFMPELHLRGIQVPKNHPKTKYLKEKGIKCYAVLYDLLPLQFPDYFEKQTGDSFHDYIVELIENYDGILSDSKAVSDDLIKYYNYNIHINLKHPVKIGYFHLGDNSFKISNNECGNITLKNFFDTDSPIFFMLGTIEPRKGHQIVLKAFEEMWKVGQDYKLCIMGHMGWKMEKFVQQLKNHTEIYNKLLFIEAATDAEVAYAYRNSTALIQASAGEGFGLPLIEAGHYNLPILCSNIPVFHEVTKDNALFFNRDEEYSLIELINTFLEKLKEGSVPSSENIKGEKWSEVADKVYKMIIKNNDWYNQIN